FAATKWAGDEWRKMIRPQYDYRADHGFHVSIDGMVEEREHLGFDHAEDMVTVALHHHYDPIDTLF
ncbi:MAG: hypothetical protein GWO44_01705, partial [Thermoplasmata archaeon]|nr:hypothetical protein [Thermoplasmata archaeon]NIY02010.1 hypothetical protein [Thermoplasmata archaeon]